MAGGDLDLIRQAFVPWREGRISEFGAFLDPELTWDTSSHPLPDFPTTGSGADAFLRHMADYHAGWVNYDISEIEALQVGRDVVFVCKEEVAMRETDMTIERIMVVVWTVRAERLTRFRIFDTREAALAALGGTDR